ncbi:Phosphoribosyl 1,2-cyclic phosphate phosphodiesterase [Pleomorphomonas sp. T1.2MG-36]|uniref:MBL fold metallo-hydrolase n=1 Tax=Pleomorphomonas sp. T1.2MG-36 TaxID=3041167 RepID=UPI0024778A2C|nr:MBL fold metallo-hydrolase [Pleomorphomonas sp. T1.2MG-36]CAI9400901.1 Phosphoribosyl 1,2-cyclic phosphate phosphodiesterase [Pleomorphomonas sp. T1.2MG-36]
MTARMRFTMLGCGASPGVPRIGNDWGACDPNEPRNRRLRSSLLVERFGEGGGVTRVIVDTGPDFREQVLRAGVGEADAVLYTHSHADHIHGIDELRQFFHNSGHRVPVYADEATAARLKEAFGYCFETPLGSGYPPIVAEHRVDAGVAFSIEGKGGTIDVVPYEQTHGDIVSIGYRFGSLAYSSDVSAIPEESWALIEGVEVFIVDALRYRPHVSHFSVDQAIEAGRRVGAKLIVLTHMHHDLDYRTLVADLPAGVVPAFDGMVIENDAVLDAAG